MSTTELIYALREATKSLRTKSYPISDLIPLLQEAADKLESLDDALAEWRY